MTEPSGGPTRTRRVLRGTALLIATMLVGALVTGTGALAALRLQYTGTPVPVPPGAADASVSVAPGPVPPGTGPDTTLRGGTGRDAVWLGHAWVDGRNGPADINAIADRVRGTNVRDLYVHAGPLEDDGRLDPTRAPNSRWLVDALHGALPGVRVQAWLGNIVGPDHLDLRRPDRRANTAGAAAQALDLGFDGVHYDLEPMANDNRDYLEVLARAHDTTRARGAVLSVATHQLEPTDNLAATVRLTRGVRNLIGGAAGPLDLVRENGSKWWTPEYFRAVGERVDQIAVMAYDTWMPTRGLFGGYIARQTELALRHAPPGVDVLIGLPAYHDDTIGHHEDAEKVATAARAVRTGMRGAPGTGRLGVAMYVDFAATEEDWAAYRREWVGR